MGVLNTKYQGRDSLVIQHNVGRPHEVRGQSDVSNPAIVLGSPHKNIVFPNLKITDAIRVKKYLSTTILDDTVDIRFRIICISYDMDLD